MRRSLLALALCALFVATAVPAAAHVEGLHVDRKAFYDAGDIHVSGTIACTFGETYEFRLNVRQQSGSGARTDSFSCESGPDGFLLRVSPEVGSFALGGARVRMVVVTSDGDRKTLSRTVRVVPLD